MKLTDEMLKTYIRYNNKCIQQVDEHDYNLMMKLDGIKSKLTAGQDETVRKVYNKLQRANEPTFPLFGLGLMLLIPTILTLIFARGVETIDWTLVRVFGIASILILAFSIRTYTNNKKTKAQLDRCVEEIKNEDKSNNVLSYGFSVYEGEGTPSVKGYFSTPIASLNAGLTLAMLRLEEYGDNISHIEVEHFNNAALCMKAQIATTSGKEVVVDVLENH